MPGQRIRKIPERRQKSRATKNESPPHTPFAAWLPALDADFSAWGKAAEQAGLEFKAVWKKYQQHRGDEKLRQAVEDARHLWFYALERAYPPGFWEGIADLLAGKTESVEMYIAFLEADLHFFRSGYAKSEVIRGLKRLLLTSSQKRRLQTVVLRVIDRGFRREFRDYCRLARSVQSPDWLREIETRLSSSDPNHSLRARWVLDACIRS